jgi:hypothetical protein
MARKFIDGFESGGDDLWDAENNATVVSSAGLDMDGDYCLDLNAITEYIEKNITATDTIYLAVLWRFTSASQSKGIFTVKKDGTVLATVRKNGTSYLLEATRGTILVATGTKTLNINTTYLIEAYIKIDDAAGKITVKVDGVQDIDFTGDTKPGADTQFNRVLLGYNGNAGTYSQAYFDNFIMDDAAWIGDTKIQAVVPTGAGATTGWTPSAGNNWACVDEKPASDVDYVSINVNDVTDTYAAGNLAGTIGTVKCVQVQSRMRIDGAPTPNNIKLVVRSGAADYLSGDKAVPSSEKSLWNLWETDPADAAAWTEADVNAMEIGVKSAA